ncbi:uncharacterized protein PHALS_14745 [Plasmopara halstedii]|uniref:Uncharacterized protein n=1 Tax=Plasmopara halstedii TaxID=4781 RepID=A0A0P1ASF1_PLAHL|nr:uncharacterized protein PHALS_14745 [Plasmopara halstedii]CEG43791.1 hypothetical protein PHALS_14745 [Plasmopara halstedii]|eukprot:XP_024580160.1 hypothetical protein PHALS_14745 [Plasmopara halstedii]
MGNEFGVRTPAIIIAAVLSFFYSAKTLSWLHSNFDFSSYLRNVDMQIRQRHKFQNADDPGKLSA